MGKRRSILNTQRPSTCNGLTIYRQRKSAEGAAGRARRRTGRDIQAFPCRYKSHFHIGDQTKFQKKTEAA